MQRKETWEWDEGGGRHGLIKKIQRVVYTVQLLYYSFYIMGTLFSLPENVASNFKIANLCKK